MLSLSFRFFLVTVIVGSVVVGSGMQRRGAYRATVPPPQPVRDVDRIRLLPQQRTHSAETEARAVAAPIEGRGADPGTDHAKRQANAQREATPRSGLSASDHPDSGPPGFVPPLMRPPESITFPPPRDDEPRNIPKTILIAGNPRGEGLYTVRIRIPRGMAPTPHVHPDSRMSVVLSGVYYFGYGDIINADTATALGPGAFFTEPAGMPHFGWAKDAEVVIQSTGYGPSGTRVVPMRGDENGDVHGSVPDSARREESTP